MSITQRLWQKILRHGSQYVITYYRFYTNTGALIKSGREQYSKDTIALSVWKHQIKLYYFKIFPNMYLFT